MKTEGKKRNKRIITPPAKKKPPRGRKKKKTRPAEEAFCQVVGGGKGEKRAESGKHRVRGEEGGRKRTEAKG